MFCKYREILGREILRMTWGSQSLLLCDPRTLMASFMRVYSIVENLIVLDTSSPFDKRHLAHSHTGITANGSNQKLVLP